MSQESQTKKRGRLGRRNQNLTAQTKRTLKLTAVEKALSGDTFAMLAVEIRELTEHLKRRGNEEKL